jgi:membrane protein
VATRTDDRRATGTADGDGRGDGGDGTDGGRPGLVKRVVARVDAVQHERPWLAVPVATFKKFGEDRAGSLAGLIAYYGFFSLFPLLLVFVAVLGLVLSGRPELQRDILDSALAQFPVLGDQIRENTGRMEASGFALVVGVGSALWAGTGVMKAAEDAMNDVWDVPMRSRPNFVMTVVRALLMLVVLGTGVIVTAGLNGLAGGVVSWLPLRLLGIALGVALNVAIFLLGFRVLTVRDVAVRGLLPGAVLAGLAWVVLQGVGGYLLTNQVQNAGQTYGAFAVVIGLLWWLYLQAQVVLLAAELNVVLADGLWPRSLSGPRTPADFRALGRHAEVEERAE